MTTSQVDQIYLARDVYREWKRRVARASECISIYAPYCNRLLLYLIDATSLEPSQVTIVTDLTPPSLLEVPSQLSTIKRALSLGVCVRSLEGLHAKVLLVDDEYVTLGSQNFTFRGRKNKEATAAPVDSLKGTKFVDTLIHWREQAETVDEEFVDLLHSKLARRIRQHRKLLQDTQDEFDALRAQHEAERQDRLVRQLDELARQSRIQMVHGQVHAKITFIDGDAAAYYTLMADDYYDMTRWRIKRPDGTVEPYRLGRLSVYPMLAVESLRMGFARIGKTRITYIRNEVDWSGRRLELGGMSLSVRINFPETDTALRNITVTLSHWNAGSCEFDLLFHGSPPRIVDRRYFRSPYRVSEYEHFMSLLESVFFPSPEHLEGFFARFFTPFTYKVLGRDRKNVLEYLDGTRYRLSIIQYAENPFLMVSKTS